MRQKKRKDYDGPERVRDVLFKGMHGYKCDVPELSRMTGIPETSLRRYISNPGTITLDRLCLIIEAVGTKPEDAAYMMTGRAV